MLAYSKEHNILPRMTSVSKDWRNWLQKEYHGKILFHKEWDGKDYIYDPETTGNTGWKKDAETP